MNTGEQPVFEPVMMLEGAAKESLYAFAHTMLCADNLKVAINAFRVFVRFAPTDERAWLGLGACHEKLDEIEIAVELYGAGATTAWPESARCHLGFARLTDDKRLKEEHLERAREIVDQDDDYALAGLVLAIEATL